MPPDNQPTNIAAVILAAGQSQRMGVTNKLLASVHNKPMLHHVVEAALHSQVQSTTVVTGFEAEKVAHGLSHYPLNIVHNPNYASGMASSLRVGLASLKNVRGALILLADMPFISAKHLNTLIECTASVDDTQILIPVHQGRRGNPVLWPSHYFPIISALTGDTGARALMADYSDKLWEVELNTTAIFNDVDTREDLIEAERYT